MTSQPAEPRRRRPRKQAGALREFLDAQTTEKAFQAAVIDALELYGYRWYHVYDSRRSNAGWPDIFALRVSDKRIIVIECKTEKGTLSDEQEEWLDAFDKVGVLALEAHPSGWQRLLERLK